MQFTVVVVREEETIEAIRLFVERGIKIIEYIAL